MSYKNAILAFVLALIVSAISFVILWCWHHSIGLSTVWRKGFAELLAVSSILSLLFFFPFFQRVIPTKWDTASQLRVHIRDTILLYGLVVIVPAIIYMSWPPSKSRIHVLALGIMLFITAVVAVLLHLCLTVVRKHKIRTFTD